MTVGPLTRRLAFWIVLVMAGCSSVDRFDEETSRKLAEQFLNGEIELDCGLSCSYISGYNATDLRQLHDASDWKQLAKEVIRIGQKEDLMYYYLGRSAEGLGANQAAVIYYNKALGLSKNSSTSCASLFNLCKGLDVPELARQGLNRL